MVALPVPAHYDSGIFDEEFHEVYHRYLIVNRIGTGEAYTFGDVTEYSTQTLTEPFNNAAWATGANTKFLTGMV